MCVCSIIHKNNANNAWAETKIIEKFNFKYYCRLDYNLNWIEVSGIKYFAMFKLDWRVYNLQVFQYIYSTPTVF